MPGIGASEGRIVTASEIAREGTGVTGDLPPKYWAFISYSHRDRKWADWLHKRMETYRVPRQIVGGDVPARVFPVFRDRDELSSAADLSGKVVAALGESRNLVVICSPNAAPSRWVNEEIRHFLHLGRADRVFAFIVAGQPEAGDCFPPALTEHGVEPIAADARDVGDGKKNAFLKLMAGVLGVEFDKLRRREYERQLRTRTVWTGALIVLAVVLGALSLYANSQRLVAIERQKVAMSRLLATEALGQMGTSLDRSLLLAVESYRIAPTAEARRSLLQVLQSSPGVGRVLRGHTKEVTRIAISPDGKTIASGDAGAAVRLWSIDGRALSERPIHGGELARDDEIRELTFSPDGTLVALGTLGGAVWFGDVGTGKQRFVDSSFGATISALAFTPDSKQVMVGAVSLQVLDPQADALVEPAFSSFSLPDTAALSPDGSIVAVAVQKGLQFYDYRSRAPIGDAIAQGEGADVLVFSPDGATLAHTTRNGSLRLLDVATREWKGPPVRHEGYVLAAAFGTGDRLLTIWSDGSLRTHDSRNLEAASESVPLNAMTAAAFSRDLKTIVTGHADGAIRIQSLDSTLHAIGTGVRTGEWLNDVTFSPDGRMLAIADDSGVTLREVASGTERRSSKIYGVLSIAFTPDGRTLATAGKEGVAFWILDTNEVVVATGKDKGAYHWRIVVTPDGSLAAFGGDSLRLWDMRQRKVVATLTPGKGSVEGLAIDPAGTLLAAASEDKSIYFFELPSGKPAGSPVACGLQARSLTFTPDGKSLIVGGPMTVFDVKTRAQSGRPLTESPGGSEKIAFSPDHTLMAAAGGGRTLVMLDWATRQQLGGPLFPPSQHEVFSGVAFSPDGTTLAVSERRQMLWLLDGSAEQWIARACRVANRNLTPEEWARYVPDQPYRETCR